MSDAQQGLAPDCLQRALRSRFRQQVKPGVRRTGPPISAGLMEDSHEQVLDHISSGAAQPDRGE